MSAGSFLLLNAWPAPHHGAIADVSSTAPGVEHVEARVGLRYAGNLRVSHVHVQRGTTNVSKAVKLVL